MGEIQEPAEFLYTILSGPGVAIPRNVCNQFASKDEINHAENLSNALWDLGPTHWP